jgi:hypothetical protein
VKLATVTAVLVLAVAFCAAALIFSAAIYENFHPCVAYTEKHARLVTKLLFRQHDCIQRG